MKNAYSIYETKAHLSRLLRRVKEGREVVIAERGKPIAKVIPLHEATSFEEKMAHLVSMGSILPGKRKNIPRGIKRVGGLKRFLKDRQ